MTRLALAQLRIRYVVEGRPLDAATEEALKADARAGARTILDAVAKRRFENRSEGQRLRTMLRYETALWATGVDARRRCRRGRHEPAGGPGVGGGRRVRAGIADTGRRRLQEARCGGARSAGGRDQGRRLSRGRSASPRSRRSTPSTSTGPACSPCAARSKGLPLTPEHVLIDGRRVKELRIPQQRIVQRRLQEPDDCRRLDPRQDRA